MKKERDDIKEEEEGKEHRGLWLVIGSEDWISPDVFPLDIQNLEKEGGTERRRENEKEPEGSTSNM